MTKHIVQQHNQPSVSASVRILPDDVTLDVRPGESIVEAVRRHGLRTRYLCRRGGCGACKADLVAGTVRYTSMLADSVLSPAEEAAGKCLPCRAQPQGDATIRLSAKDCLRDVFGSVISSGRSADDEREMQ